MNRIETQTGYWELRDDGIAVMSVNDGTVDTLETATDNVARLEELAGDKAPVPIMILYQGVKKQTLEARKYYSQSEAAKRSAYVKLRSTLRSRRTALRSSGLRACILPIYSLYSQSSPAKLPGPEDQTQRASTRRQNHQLVNRRSRTLFTKPNSINVASKFDPP